MTRLFIHIPAIAIILLAVCMPAAATAQRHGTCRSCTLGSGERCREVLVYDCCNIDREPQFPGGETAMIKFINAERRYPRAAYQERVQGRVTCGFVVDTDGTIRGVEVIRGTHPALDREAVRVISAMPRWEAGRLGGEAVPTYYTLTIPFRL